MGCGSSRQPTNVDSSMKYLDENDKVVQQNKILASLGIGEVKQRTYTADEIHDMIGIGQSLNLVLDSAILGVEQIESIILTHCGSDLIPRAFRLDTSKPHITVACEKGMGHSAPISCLSSIASGTAVISCAHDSSCCVWAKKRGCNNEIHLFKKFVVDSPKTVNLSLCAGSYDGKRIVSSAADILEAESLNSSDSKEEEVQYDTYCWDICDNKQKAYSHHATEVTALAFCQSDSLVATGSRDGIVVVWWVRTGEVLKKLSEHKAPIMSISFPTTELLCTADPAKLCLWSDFRLSMVQTCSNLLVSGIRLVRFIDTEYLMIVAASSSIVQLLSVSQREVSDKFKLNDAALCCSLSTKLTNRTCVGCMNGSVTVFDFSQQ